LVVNPNASDLMVERRWPVERFAELIDRLVARTDFPVILIGAPLDLPHVATVVAQIRRGNGRILNLAGDLSLGGLLALSEGAACVITNDTGPMHMAWALGAPTVCLFGRVDPRHYAWKGTGVEVLYQRVYCSPCVHEVNKPPCHGNNVCMKLISVDAAIGAVERILSGVCVSEHPRSALDSTFFIDQDTQPLGRVIRGAL
jgi:ADP-heptose:LPS heptosyltransferase